MDFDLSWSVEWSLDTIVTVLKERKNIKKITNKNYLLCQCHTNENEIKNYEPCPFGHATTNLIAVELQWMQQGKHFKSEMLELALSHFWQQNQDMTRDWQMDVSTP